MPAYLTSPNFVNASPSDVNEAPMPNLRVTSSARVDTYDILESTYIDVEPASCLALQYVNNHVRCAAYTMCV